MNGIKMAKMDFYGVKSQTIMFLVALLVFLVLFGYASVSFDLLGLICAWVIPLLTATMFQVQERDSLDRLYSTLPLKQKDVVAGRYMLVIVIYLLSLVASLMIYLGFSMLLVGEISGSSILAGLGFSVPVFSLITGLQMPLYFGMGYSKARLWALLPFLVMVGGYIALVGLPTPEATFLSDHLMIVVPILMVVSAAMLYLSYRVSVVAYRKRA